MSVNRENIIWQSRDGSWNRGFYDYYSTGNTSDSDYEWDVEYTDDFNWVSTGHSSADSAKRAWKGANPGGSNVIPYSPETASQIISLDDKAAQAYQAVRDPQKYWKAHRPTYQGPAKARNVFLVARDLYKAKIDAHYYAMYGYDNSPDTLIPDWQKYVDDYAVRADGRGVELLNRERETYRKNLSAVVEKKKSEEHTLRRIGGYSSYGTISQRVAERDSRAKKREALERAEQEIALLEKPLQLSKTKEDSAQPPSNKSAQSPVGQSSKGTSGKYHINPQTGRPNKCYAIKRACPYGGQEDHYESKVAARKAYEVKMKKKQLQTFSNRRKST